MEHFTALNLPTLIGLLSDFTIHYSEMIIKPSSKTEEVQCCLETIQLLQKEIAYRKAG